MRDFATSGGRTLELERANLIGEILKPTLEIVIALDASQRLRERERMRETERQRDRETERERG